MPTPTWADLEPHLPYLGVLEPGRGLVGDNWSTRGGWSTADGSANPRAEVTVMSHRMIRLLTESPDVQALAGDQL